MGTDNDRTNDPSYAPPPPKLSWWKRWLVGASNHHDGQKGKGWADAQAASDAYRGPGAGGGSSSW